MSQEHDPLTAAIIRAGEQLEQEDGWGVWSDEEKTRDRAESAFVRIVRAEVASLVEPGEALRIRRETLVAAIRRNEAEREALMNEIEALAVAEQRAEAEGGGA